jgi:hypothetical protein
MPQLIYKGKTYASIDDMPPDIREIYKRAMGILVDNDHNGVPDILEGKSAGNTPIIQSTQIQIDPPQFIADGKVYASAAELPLDKRQKLAQAMARLDPLLMDVKGDGLSDIMKSEISEQSEKAKPDESMVTQEFPGAGSQNPPSSMISEVTINYGLIARIMLAVLIFAAICGVGAYLVLPLLK